MEITKQEASLILGALDRVDVRGLETAQAVVILGAKLQKFLQPVQPPVDFEEEDGDVPESAE